jgi:type VI secretion system secreted protein VgrG
MPPPITVVSPLQESDLVFESMTASAGLSVLGEMQVTLLSDDPNLSTDEVLGHPFSVEVALPEGSKRQFNGYITRFALGASRGRRYGYQATVRPWLWFLTRTSDCRVFQEMTVPDIVKKVFEDHSIANFEFKTFRKYRKWDYCVQYRESDFNFIARLLEHEGIYWYFENQNDQHRLILVDSQSAHDAVPGHEALPYFEHAGSAPPDTEYISNWSFSREVKTGKAALLSYDFERPSANLRVDKDKPREYELSDYEMFDYQGDYTRYADGRQLADDRIDETQTRFQTLRGSSNGHRIEVGRLLKLSHHPRDDQNAEYLITGLTIHAHANGAESGGSEGGFECSFSAIPSGQQFRPARRTPKPFVQGPQSAVVVGPGGEEIFTDKYGRVKIQFHWDRYGQHDDKSSCWVRVSHPWAGKNFGAIHIPRIGQEVVVSFLEGDPDQPLITGRVYNAEQMPPWDLPANATQSGILTRSSKGGGYGNANAIRFEDKAGSEQLWIHAEKDQDIEVEHDETHWVGHDRSKSVDNDETNVIKHDRTETVGNNEKISIGVDRNEKVGSNETIHIGASRTETVGGNEKITITGNREEKVSGNEIVNVVGSRLSKIDANETKHVEGSRKHLVDADEEITVGGKVTETITGTYTQEVTGAISITTPATYTVKAAGGVTFVAPGGSKFVDFQFEKIGGRNMATYGINIEGYTLHNETSLIATAQKGVSVEASIVKNTQVSAALRKAGFQMLNTDSAVLHKAAAYLAKANLTLFS